jgi:hypothetical protein
MQALKLLSHLEPTLLPQNGTEDKGLKIGGNEEEVNFDSILDMLTQSIGKVQKNDPEESFFSEMEEGFKGISSDDKEELHNIIEILNEKIEQFGLNPIFNLENENLLPQKVLSELRKNNDVFFKGKNGQVFQVIDHGDNKVQLKPIDNIKLKHFFKDKELSGDFKKLISESDLEKSPRVFNRKEKIPTELNRKEKIPTEFNRKEKIPTEFNHKEKTPIVFETKSGFQSHKNKNISKIEKNKVKFESVEDVLEIKNKIKTQVNKSSSLNAYKNHSNILDSNLNNKIIVPENIEGKKYGFENKIDHVISKSIKEDSEIKLGDISGEESSPKDGEEKPSTPFELTLKNKSINKAENKNIMTISNDTSIDETISKISNYIKGHYNKTDENLTITVRHESLGKFQLDVKENNNKALEIKILTGSEDGNKFFIKNERDIFNNLKNLGFKIDEVKIVASGDLFTENKESLDHGKDQNSGNEKNQKNSDGNKDRKDDTHRRENLWEYYRERMLG